MRGKPELVTNTETIEAYLAGELENTNADYYFMSAKDPDNHAIDSLMNRVFGRPKESVDVSVGVTLKLDV